MISMMTVKQYFDQPSHNIDGPIDISNERGLFLNERVNEQRPVDGLIAGTCKVRRLVFLEIEHWKHVHRPEAARLV